jgi:hypothetical protein
MAAAVQAIRAGDQQRVRERGIVGKSGGRLWSALLSVAACLGALPAMGAECSTTTSDIATDRPDVTNSSIVVPVGSLQSENGINLTSARGAKIIDGTNSRLRLGIAPCLEILVDLPTYFGAVRGQASSGFSNVAPAVKWQISPLPGKFDLSATFGVGLPTGATGIAGTGVQPYVQFPWSYELGGGWSVTGMATTFAHPAEPARPVTQQATFVIERAIGRADVFVEYVGDFLAPAGPSHLINTGAAYRITRTQQIDFHAGFGLNSNAPAYFFGVGYSFRLDGLF